MTDGPTSQLVAFAAAFLLACGGSQPSTPAPAPEEIATAENPPAAQRMEFTDERVMELGRGYLELLHARDHDRLWQHLTPQAKARFGTVAEFRSGMNRTLDDLGAEQGMLRENVELPRAGMLADKLYLRISHYAGPGETPVHLLIGMKRDGSIVGMQIRRVE